MFGNIIKNKVLCCLLSVSAVSSFAHGQNQSTTSDFSEKTTVSGTRKVVDDYAETVETDGMTFYVLPKGKKAEMPQPKQLPPSSIETQKIDVEGLPFLVEKVDDVDERLSEAKDLSRAELNELLEISETSTQPVEESSADKEEKKKKTEEMKNLLARLDANKVSSNTEIQSDLKKALAVDEESDKTNISSDKIEEKILEQKEIQDEKVPDVEEIVTNHTIHSEDSLASFQALNDEIEQKPKNIPSKVVKVEQKPEGEKKEPFNPQKRSMTSEEKSAVSILGGVVLFGLVAAGAMISSAYKMTPSKRRVKRQYDYDDGVSDMRDILVDVIHHPIKGNQEENKTRHLLPSEETSVQKPEEGQVCTDFNSEEKKDVPEQKNEEKQVAKKTVVRKKKVLKAVEPEDFRDLFERDHEGLFQWLCAVKAIYDIQKERNVLRREMAQAKKETNQAEKDKIKDRINARRKILNAKRREACLRANGKEMQEIKKIRHKLTLEMTRAKRAKKKGEVNADSIIEKVIAARFGLKQREKQMNNQIKQWKLFVAKYKQSKQAA